MFRYDYELNRWVSFKRKASYTMRHEFYVDDDEIDPTLPDLEVEDIVLTDEQNARLEAVKHTEEVSSTDIAKYVMTDELPIDNPVMVEADKQARTRKAILSTIDVATIPPETLMESGLTKEWKDTEYFTAGEPITNEGSIYKVLQSHAKQSDWTPELAPSLFAPLLTSPTGEVLEWVQPDSTNAYNIGDKVLYKGVVWTSLIDSNVTIPDGDVPYNRYWTDK